MLHVLSIVSHCSLCFFLIATLTNTFIDMKHQSLSTAITSSQTTTPKTQNTISSFSECHEHCSNNSKASKNEDEQSSNYFINPKKKETGDCFNIGHESPGESASLSRHEEDEFSHSHVKRIQFDQDVPNLYVLDTEKRKYCVC